MAARKRNASSSRRSSTSNDPASAPEWYTLEEAHLILDRSKSRVCRYIQKGKLASNGQKGSRALRVSAASLCALRLELVSSPAARNAAITQEIKRLCVRIRRYVNCIAEGLSPAEAARLLKKWALVEASVEALETCPTPVASLTRKP